ncbi:MAG: nuclear transport factor 2 family protein [Chitinophagaceae bacterium]
MKHYIIAALLLSLAACNSQPAVPVNTDDGSAASIQVAQNMFAAFNRHDWKAMAGYYSNPASFLDPSYGKSFVTQSRDSVIAKYTGLQQMLPDVKDSIISIFARGNKVSVEFISSGTLPDGQKFTLPISTVLTIKDSLIVSDATYYDNSGK